jgi:ribosomal protein S18 acetylase RimI-like enzyme
MSDPELGRRQAASQRAFYRMIAGAPNDSTVVDVGGVQATVVPARPGQSIFNSVVYDLAPGLAAALPAVAGAYAAAGVEAWTVWVPPGDADAVELLLDAGHALDGSPMQMGAAISDIDLEARQELDLEPDPTWRVVAECGDRAWEMALENSMLQVVDGIEDPAVHLYAARLDGRVACVLMAREHDGDCYFWFVSTVEEARGRGLASDLMRHALRNARDRGCETTTLESSPMGERAYTRLGFRPLGRYGLWERRS